MGCGKSQLAEANADEELPQEGHWDLEQGLDTVWYAYINLLYISLTFLKQHIPNIW